ncbi:DNA-binding NarL/FixJ family response regulator [Inhella inkyongensis]|uniref:DNA-binding NarL/FixJ family response regulator n=1 Tax=Inhella inkyongensis TaxID=392593 RepID=A0A840S235_9BURK|nr:response regulator transcription factor [Inhella inkyongensis]MBB5202741.1 DNA-binding NarL/FixJ family response regulator [Inhella inkyongensis]
MNLLLVDDHPLFGLGFSHALESARPGLRVQHALTLQEGLARAAREPQLDLLLLDYRLGLAEGADGLQGLLTFGRQHPLLARALISGDEEPWLAQRARAAGAAGCLGKSAPVHQMLRAIDTLIAGGEWFPASPSSLARAGPTPRQLAVLQGIAKGSLNKQIADDLGIAERTVKLHVTALFEQLQARNRTHLVVRARELGLL